MNTLKSIVTIVLITFCFSSVIVKAQEDALIHQYKFDGNLNDAVGDSDGVYVEGDGFLNFIEGHDGTPNGAINFETANGRGYMIYVGDYSPLQEGVEGEMTCTFWALWHGSTDSYQDIINKRTSYNYNQMTWGINQHAATGHMLTVRRGSGGAPDEVRFADSNQGIPEGVWTHVTVALDNENAYFYMNGELYQTLRYDQGIGYDARINMGTAGNSDGSWRPQDAYNGALDDVRFYSRKLTDEEIASIMASYDRSPANGSTEIARDRVLSWIPSESASAYDVYLGTDLNDVSDANRTNPLDVLVAQGLETNTYTHNELYEYGQTYYWRLDEIGAPPESEVVKGDVWSFTVQNYIVVEDFEDYNDFEPDTVWNTWSDGYGILGNGASAGYPDPDFVVGEHYLEAIIVHSGSRSMPLVYDNSEMLSEVTRTLNADWTQEGVVTLTVWYCGLPDNAAEPMYIALDGNAVITNDDANAALVEDWTRWDIPLQEFANQGVNLGSVNSMSIGFGNKANPIAGGSGTGFFDDIRLYLPEP